MYYCIEKSTLQSCCAAFRTLTWIKAYSYTKLVYVTINVRVYSLLSVHWWICQSGPSALTWTTCTCTCLNTALSHVRTLCHVTDCLRTIAQAHPTLLQTLLRLTPHCFRQVHFASCINRLRSCPHVHLYTHNNVCTCSNQTAHQWIHESQESQAIMGVPSSGRAQRGHLYTSCGGVVCNVVTAL